MTDNPPPPRMRATRVGTVTRGGRPVPVYVVHADGTPPSDPPQCPPGCTECPR
jgi:hypothetical protein